MFDKIKVFWLVLLTAAVVALAIHPSTFAPAPHKLGINGPSTWAIPAWFVDPANSSGCASDGNTGQSATCGAGNIGPFLTYAQIVSRWGTVSPVLGQDTALNFLSNTTERVIFDPIVTGGFHVKLVGQKTTVASGSLSGVVHKNRSTPQLLTAAVAGGLAQGELVQNTTHSSYAWTWTQVSGSTWTLSQPIAPVTLPIAWFSPPAEVDTWANSDSFTVSTLTTVNIAELRPTITEANGSLDNGVAVYHVSVPDAAFAPDPMRVNNNVSFFESNLGRTLQVEEGSTASSLSMVNVNDFLVQAQAASNSPSSGPEIVAGAVAFQLLGSGWIVDGDAILSGGASGGGAFIDSLSEGFGGIGFVYITTSTIYEVFGNVIMLAEFYGGTALWGPGGLLVKGGHLQYTSGQATAQFLLTGGMQINGSSTACALDTSGDPSVTHCGRSLIASLLDVSAVSNGFGGHAFLPWNGSITTLN